MLPFSVDWFMTGLPNIHSSVFYSVYKYMDTYTPAKKARALVEGYKLYLEQSSTGRPADSKEEPVLSFTRAWMLVRFFDSNMVQLSHCTRCRSEEHTSELQSLMRISYAVSCLKKKKKTYTHTT